MKILFISKRHPQQRDLLARPYGRFYNLPTELATLGHDVRVQLCSYRRLDSEVIERDGLVWSSHDFLTLGIARLLRTVKSEIREFRPDWIVGCSDTWAGWLAHHTSRFADCRLAIDAYDNYESYMPWNMPLHMFWRRSVRAADLVTAAGPQLAQRLQSHRRGGHPVEVIPMAADPEFLPRDKAASRASLNLPTDALLMGYIGSWARNRDTGLLLDAFRLARRERPNLRLVLSGRPPEYALREPGAIYVGYVTDQYLPVLTASLDVACIITAENRFGRYSYPAKLCEAMACHVPVVATATAPVYWMLNGNQRHLVPVGDARTFADRVLDLLTSPSMEYGPLITWPMLAQKLELILTAATCVKDKSG